MDIMTANYGGNNISVRLGDGIGGFTATTTIAVGTSPGSVFSADFDNDGNMDIATANYGSNNVSILLNTTY
jgi:hypothetical protein